VSGIRKPARLTLGLAVFLFFVIAAGRAADHEARAHYTPGQHNTRHAINLAWCGRSNTYCAASSEAWMVAGCETGGTYDVWARNSNWPPGDEGDYLGLFQMGDYARSRYGHGRDPWTQARAAHRYYVDSGRDWSPWTCKP
jgi:hypothetical protein